MTVLCCVIVDRVATVDVSDVFEACTSSGGRLKYSVDRRPVGMHFFPLVLRVVLVKTQEKRTTQKQQQHHNK